MQQIYSNSIALIGGGPASLMVIKHLVESEILPKSIFIFEKNDRLGVGMPYGKLGSNKEHIANVSVSELPKFEFTFDGYIQHHPTNQFPDFFSDGYFNDKQVIPRLLLGNYLEYLFEQYIKLARKRGTEIVVRKNCSVVDIERTDGQSFKIMTEPVHSFDVNNVIISTGHDWPIKYENNVKGWYDSPYPPSKFNAAFNGSVAIRGTSLTAVDAIKTLARLNGSFISCDSGQLTYELNPESEKFKITLFSTGGFLPALRFHSEGEAYSDSWVMSLKEIYDYKNKNGGFVDLDYVFDLNFKKPLKAKDPDFYDKIKDLNTEDFVDKMLELRREVDSFDLFKAEYREAEKSIQRQESISWKETLAAFSYAMNYPAKHFSAEDMLRLRKTMMPLISVIIASLPQSSYKEIIALYEAGIIDLIQVDKESTVVPHEKSGAVYHYKSIENEEVQQYFPLFIDAVGQQPLTYNDLPFEGLKKEKLVTSAYLSFKENIHATELLNDEKSKIYKGHNDNYYLQLPGLQINDFFQALNSYGQIIENLYIMAVPFIGGLNPDYSGLDFCDTAAERIVHSLSARELEEEDLSDKKEMAS